MRQESFGDSLSEGNDAKKLKTRREFVDFVFEIHFGCLEPVNRRVIAANNALCVGVNEEQRYAVYIRVSAACARGDEQMRSPWRGVYYAFMAV